MWPREARSKPPGASLARVSAWHLPSDWFAVRMDRHVSALRILDYAAIDDLDGDDDAAVKIRASAHTDYGPLSEYSAAETSHFEFGHFMDKSLHDSFSLCLVSFSDFLAVAVLGFGGVSGFELSCVAVVQWVLQWSWS